jgi:hypothetical protein
MDPFLSQDFARFLHADSVLPNNDPAAMLLTYFGDATAALLLPKFQVVLQLNHDGGVARALGHSIK